MMFVCYSNSVSPHQLPLARELVRKLGVENYRYVATDHLTAGRITCGWTEESEPWILYGEYGKDVARDTELENCEVLLTGIRELELFEKRAQKGLRTFYQCERWFKPVKLFDLRILGHLICVQLPGWVKMFIPCYRKMAKRFVWWIQNDSNARVFTIGPWAKKDMLRLGVPESKIVPWGYFVTPSAQSNYSSSLVESKEDQKNLKVLWVGRMLDWKRVDTIIRAAFHLVKSNNQNISLTLVGDGPELPYLQRLVNRKSEFSNNRAIITFLPSQPIAKIRSIMREHDVYVLSSDEGEGWGAALSEALEEGMVGLGTYEAGASATLLHDSRLYHAHDYKRLAQLLKECALLKVDGRLHGPGVGDWSVVHAADRLLGRIV